MSKRNPKVGDYWRFDCDETTSYTGYAIFKITDVFMNTGPVSGILIENETSIQSWVVGETFYSRLYIHNVNEQWLHVMKYKTYFEAVEELCSILYE
jgi:hypothetical protein